MSLLRVVFAVSGALDTNLAASAVVEPESSMLQSCKIIKRRRIAYCLLVLVRKIGQVKLLEEIESRSSRRRPHSYT